MSVVDEMKNGRSHHFRLPANHQTLSGMLTAFNARLLYWNSMFMWQNLRPMKPMLMSIALLIAAQTIGAKARTSSPVIEDCVKLDPSLDAHLETRNGTKIYWRGLSKHKSDDVIIAPRRGCRIRILGGLPDLSATHVGSFGLLIDGDTPNKFYPNSVGLVQLKIRSLAKKRCARFPVELTVDDVNSVAPPTPYEWCMNKNSQRISAQSEVFTVLSAPQNSKFQILIAVFRGCLYGYSVQKINAGNTELSFYESSEGVGKCR